jgi:hypothetical protein
VKKIAYVNCVQKIVRNVAQSMHKYFVKFGEKVAQLFGMLERSKY